MGSTEHKSIDPILCDWCGAPATATCIRTITSFDTRTAPATPIQKRKPFHECDRCWSQRTDELTNRELRINVPTGTLIAKCIYDPAYPGIEISFIPAGESEQIHIASVEDYVQPVAYGLDYPEEYHVPESRRGSVYCEVDKHDVSCITPGLICRVYPSIFKDWEESVNTAFDHVDYRQEEKEEEENAPF